MYSYYALQAMRFSLLKWISMMLTMLQIIQMFWGILTNYFSILICTYYPNSMQPYDFKPKTFCADISQYFILFVKFFKQSYLSNVKIKQKGKIKSGLNETHKIHCGNEYKY